MFKTGFLGHIIKSSINFTIRNQSRISGRQVCNVKQSEHKHQAENNPRSLLLTGLQIALKLIQAIDPDSVYHYHCKDQVKRSKYQINTNIQFLDLKSFKKADLSKVVNGEHCNCGLNLVQLLYFASHGIY